MNKFKRLKLSQSFYLVFALIFSCTLLTEKEVLISSTELGVYFDNKNNEYKILLPGKHNINSNFHCDIYSTTDTVFKERIDVECRDNKRFTLTTEYWFTINENKILDIDEIYGRNYIEYFVVPQSRSVIRSIVKKYNSKDIDRDSMSRFIYEDLLANTELDTLILSKSFRVNKIEEN